MENNNQNQELTEKESSYGAIIKVAGPIIISDKLNGAFINEMVKVGNEELAGEIIKIDHDKAYIQCFEDTSQLALGDPVLRTKQPLRVQLGPGIFGSVYDGIQRPMGEIHKISNEFYLPKGINVPALNQKKEWEFKPSQKIKIDNVVSGGCIFGSVVENSVFNNHKVMLPPTAKGKITFIAPEGQYNINEKILELETEGGKKEEYSMAHFWAVRKPRPICEKLMPNQPLFTGLRVLDSLFPLAQGGTCALPGPGVGKTVLFTGVLKHSNSDACVHVGCGERGNEIAQLLLDFPELSIKDQQGTSKSITQKTCLVANTSNMPLAAREASIYTGVTIAEYYRDMGYNVSMVADSLSRWSESLKVISSYLGQISDGTGQNVKLAQFFERAGRIKCLGTPDREGSLSILGSVSPPGGDFNDPVVQAVLSSVSCFWALDKKLAQVKHFPSVNWNISWSKYNKVSSEYLYEKHHIYLEEYQKKFNEILKEEEEIRDLVKLVGKKDLPEYKKFILEAGQTIRENFLQQNIFSSYDHTNSIVKTIGMMKCMIKYFDHVKSIIKDEYALKPVKLETIQQNVKDLTEAIYKMKFEESNIPDYKMAAKFEELEEKIGTKFKELIF